MSPLSKFAPRYFHLTVLTAASVTPSIGGLSLLIERAPRMATTTSTASSSELLTAIRQPVAGDLNTLNELIITELVSKVALIQAITQHIIKSGGKRLRPLLVILAARALGVSGDREHLELAAIIEFVHTATLLHDDVIDESQLRRGEQTANALWGNEASVLSGDFLYSRAFQILTRRGNVDIMRALSDTTNAIAEGEVLQLMYRNNPEVTEANYMQVITAKTAKLFESSCEIAGLCANAPTEQTQAMARYGLHLGLAFQIIDDLLDYTANAEQMGKNVGDDLAEGKVTLPLLHTLQHCSDSQKALIINTIEHGGLEHLDDILAALKTTQAAEYCLEKTHYHLNTARDALNHIPASKYREALELLLDFVVTRDY